MKALGHRSLAAFLRAALRIVLILLWVMAGLSVIGCLILILHAYGLDIPWLDISTPPAPPVAWLGTVIIAVTLTATILIVGRLRRIFVTLAEGDPFVPENANHLRVIWIALALWELSRYVLGGAWAVVVAIFKPSLPDDAPNFPVDLSLSIWFAVLTLIVLAEVFREGARMRQEQKLTI